MTAAIITQAADAQKPKSRRFTKLMRNGAGAVGLCIVLLIVLLGVLSFFGLMPYDPLAQDASARMQAPSAAHWLGTDQFGRDQLSRVAAGIVNSLMVAVVATVISAVVGIGLGVLAGYLRGVFDVIVGAVSNVLFAFPSLLLALTLASVLARNWFTVSIAVAVVFVPIFIRVARGPVLALREVEYVNAAKATGMGPLAIVWRHILPNISNIVIVQLTLSLSWAVLTEASLSYLGLGTPPPAPSLGSMVLESQTLVTIAPWLLVGPGIALVLLIIGLNLLGDGLSDVLDVTREDR
ncbi:ABC transporter permease [Agrococcus casei]|uniref:Dipeptide transport system permease protein DppC (TC 3.A.1.5.2) n=1 Tax=Agrococcus casei LMG 22410 TaxID=1255656 RepID=A0A1R4FZV0_9MICO|nr:ABC transporter permease [Agrococcus casei]SJM61454.1 Dipeptide transport system permease protein DppC (TC 3.A.1.5.2) [Agrococcus casei LMG 22410]